MNYPIIADCGRSGPVVSLHRHNGSNIHHSMSENRSLMSFLLTMAYPYDFVPICVRGQSYKDYSVHVATCTYCTPTTISTHPHINLGNMCPIHSDVRLGFCVPSNPPLMRFTKLISLEVG